MSTAAGLLQGGSGAGGPDTHFVVRSWTCSSCACCCTTPHSGTCTAQGAKQPAKGQKGQHTHSTLHVAMQKTTTPKPMGPAS